MKIGRSETYKKHRNQYDVIKINMQEFLSATSGIDEMLRMLNDYLIFDLREQYSQVRFRDEKNLVQVMKDLTYDNEKENVSIPNREVSQEYINAISRFPFCNTTMKTRSSGRNARQGGIRVLLENHDCFPEEGSRRQAHHGRDEHGCQEGRHRKAHH